MRIFHSSIHFSVLHHAESHGCGSSGDQKGPHPAGYLFVAYHYGQLGEVVSFLDITVVTEI